MVYVDSDGVLADFNGYVESINPDALKDRGTMYRDIMVKHSDDCFLASKPLKNGMLMQMVATDPEYYVLTSLPNFDDIQHYTGLDGNIITRILAKLKENKFKWFEQQGVPRCKVIITDKRSDKFNYCCSGDVLYDDFRSTCDKWNSLGGIGIFVKH